MWNALVVDGDDERCNRLVGALTAEGIDVVTAASPGDVRRTVADTSPDIVLLSAAWLGAGGPAFCRTLRSVTPALIVVLGERGRDGDLVPFLDAGADHLVTMPWRLRETVARTRAALRRLPRPTSDAPDSLTFGSLVVDCSARRLLVDDEPIAMPRREFDLLELLVRNSSRVVTRAELLEALWGASTARSKTLDVHMRRLRLKLEAAGHNCRIVTVRGLGFRFEHGIVVEQPAGDATA